MIVTSAALAAVVTASLTGCGSENTDGQATATSDAAATTTSSADTTSAADAAGSGGDSSAAGGSFDLCSVLSVDDAKPFARSTMPIALRKTLSSYQTDGDAMLNCKYGNYITAGLTLSVPLTKQRPTSAMLAQLAPLGGGPDGTEIAVGSEKGYASEDEFNKSVAFMHGKVPFVLHWKALREVEGESMSIPQLTKLAETVAAKLPTSRSDLKLVDLPTQCDPLKAEPIVGKVTAASGSADEDKLLCSYAGEKGVLTFDSTKDDPAVLEKTTNLNNQTRPELRIDPQLAPDVTVWQKSRINVGGLYVDGIVRNAGSFTVKYEPPSSLDRGAQFDPEESKVVTDFASAVRGWGA